MVQLDSASLFIVSLLLTLCYLFLQLWLVTYRFRKAGVRYVRPLPFFGNLIKSIFMIRHIGYLLKDAYDAFPNDRYVVFYQMMQPFFLIRDIDLIRKITIHDFKRFSDRFDDVDEKQDPLLGRSLTFLKGQEWSQMRSNLTSHFKSKYLKNMIPVVTENTETLVTHMKREIIHHHNICSKKGKIIDMDVLNLFKSYFTDVIASLCFGVKMNFYDAKKENIFLRMLDKLRMSHSMFLRYLLARKFLGFLRLVNISFFDKRIRIYFKSIMTNAMESVKNQENTQNDFRDHFLKMEIEWSREHTTSQSVMFMLAGSDTMASTLGFLIHEITVQPQIQKELVKEINNLSIEEFNLLTIEVLDKLFYMDMVIYETLRKWPQTTAGLDRTCTAEIKIQPPRDGLAAFEILPGDGIMISVFALHRDPQYWENPNEFNPERFSEENKVKIKPFTYLPFGIGPRTCIGKRLALMSMKIALVHLLRSFEFKKTNGTKNEIDYDVNSFTLKPRDSWVGVQNRTQDNKFMSVSQS